VLLLEGCAYSDIHQLCKNQDPLQADPVHWNLVTGLPQQKIISKQIADPTSLLPTRFASDSTLNIHPRRNWEIFCFPFFLLPIRPIGRWDQNSKDVGSPSQKPAKTSLVFSHSQEKSRIHFWNILKLNYSGFQPFLPSSKMRTHWLYFGEFLPCYWALGFCLC
jgi:hypothetical protein